MQAIQQENKHRVSQALNTVRFKQSVS